MSQQANSHFRGTARFQLLALLGRGASGVVYEAFDRELAAPVALKVLSQRSGAGIASFKNEFRALQGVRHDNLVELNELLFDEGHWLLVMELVRGIPIVAYARGAAAELRPSVVALGEPKRTDEETVRRADDPENTASPARRAPGRLCEDRVRASFSQLAAGLCALHAANKIHRDLKPSNVLVTAQGKVAILDFGLVLDLGSRGSVEQTELAGTPGYMSPEQAARAPLHPASDWYSVGAMLYEALTGQRPAACHFRPPSALCPNVPADLSELCLELLRQGPQARPSGATIATRLSLGCDREAATSRGPALAADTIFVGREAELARLEQARARALSGSATAVVIEGESGVGKTALLEKFLRSLPNPTLVLRGRCFERESVPYKAFDGIIESLCKHLSALPASEARALLGQQGSIIARAFPLLDQLLVGLGEVAAGESSFEPHAERQRVFSALKRVLARVSARTLTILVVDDMQWADTDSLLLLSILMRPPSAQHVLFLLLQRPLSRVAEIELPGEITELSIGPLSDAEALTLVGRLLDEQGSPHVESMDCLRLAREAAGHPLFIRELLHHAATSKLAAEVPPRLEEMIWSRVALLDTGPRLLVELASVAGRPLMHATLAAALARTAAVLGTKEEPSASFSARTAACLAELRHASLVRTRGPRQSDLVEPFHDRVRDAVLAHLPLARRRTHHRALALSLAEVAIRDEEALAVHFHAAGETERAFEHAVAAADDAARSLAFERAARLYRWALTLGAATPAARRRLQERFGAALANAGRGGDAAAAYNVAAEGAVTKERLRLQQLAAEQWLRSGYIERGVLAFFVVLRELGVGVPRHRWLALLSLLVLRARIALTSFRRRRTPAPRAAAESARLEATWTAAICLTMFDNVRSAELQCRNTLLALRAGAPVHVLRAHTAEAMFLGLGGQSNRRRIERLLSSASELERQIGDAEAGAWVALSRGATAFFLGDWAQGESECARAEAVFEHRPGARFELGSARAFRVWSAMMCGNFREVLTLVPLYVQEAEERGDLYSATYQMTGFSNVAWLSADDVAEARRRLALVEERWPPALFDVPRYMNLMAATHIELYAGTGDVAYRRVLRDWASLRWGVAFRAQITRFGMRFARGLSALAAYDATRDQALLADARSCARAIHAEQVTWSQCFAELLLSGVALRKQRLADSLLHLERAEAHATTTGMLLHRAVARYRQGELIAGDSGRALQDGALAFMHAQEIRRPDRMLHMLSPAI